MTPDFLRASLLDYQQRHALTRVELAARLGVSHRTVERWTSANNVRYLPGQKMRDRIKVVLTMDTPTWAANAAERSLVLSVAELQEHYSRLRARGQEEFAGLFCEQVAFRFYQWFVCRGTSCVFSASHTNRQVVLLFPVVDGVEVIMDVTAGKLQMGYTLLRRASTGTNLLISGHLSDCVPQEVARILREMRRRVRRGEDVSTEMLQSGFDAHLGRSHSQSR